MVAVVAAVSGCSKSQDMYDPDWHTKDAMEVYKQNFLNYVGGKISPNQVWGFDKSYTTTRGAESGYFIDDIYADRFYKDFVSEAIGLLPEETKVTPSTYVKTNYELIANGKFTFDIFFSNTKKDIEIGYYYYNPKTQTAANRTEVKLVNQYVTDLASKKYFQWTTKEVPQEEDWRDVQSDYGMRIWNSGRAVRARQFSVDVSDVPEGCYFGFYVRNPEKNVTVYTNQYLNSDPNTTYIALIDKADKDSELRNSYIIGIEDELNGTTDYDCNDVMIAMDRVPTVVDAVEPLVWRRIIAEDLNVHGEATDFDFNDIVLDVVIKNGKAKCILQAAGATLKIRINKNDALEVHKLFNVDTNVMVNTNADKKGFSNSAKRDPVAFDLDGTFTDIKDITIEVYKSDTWMELVAPQGEAACKIAVDIDFVWPDERVSLKDLYPDFPKYVRDNVDVDSWWKKF